MLTKNASSVWHRVAVVRMATLAGNHKNKPFLIAESLQQETRQGCLSLGQGHAVQIDTRFWFRFTTLHATESFLIHSNGL